MDHCKLFLHLQEFICKNHVQFFVFINFLEFYLNLSENNKVFNTKINVYYNKVVQGNNCNRKKEYR